MKFFAWVLLASFFLSGFLPVFAGGAIDLVALKKQEEERRKKIGKSKQTVNDSNLATAGGGGKSYGFVQMEAEAPPEATTEVPPVAGAEGDVAEDRQPDFWKNQKLELETRIAQLREGIAGEQSELNRLWSDYYIKNIPAEQEAIKVQIAQLTNQIEQKKLFLSQAEAQLEELYEKARKAGVPPGWLR